MKRQIIGLARRSFLARLGVGGTAVGAALAGFVPPAAAESVAGAAEDGWQPARHAEDAWFDQAGTAKHRFFLDSTTADALGRALLFTNNYFTANKTAYGLADSDLSVVICVRHESTAFAFDDAMWAKYGAALSQRIGFSDPKTKEAAGVNVYQSSGYGSQLRNNGVTLDSLTKRGMRLAVCQMSTRANANAIVQKLGSGTVDDVFKELTEHLVPNSHLVPAGIVAVNRAQEHGYSFAYIS
jgi:intracellular sulfur oxidation DsrE/DsrF family protein